jgi:uridine monophosphate synthetase
MEFYESLLIFGQPVRFSPEHSTLLSVPKELVAQPTSILASVLYSNNNKMELENIVLELESLGGVKFAKSEKFILKNGIESPVYFDLRVIISKPPLMKRVADVMWKIILDSNTNIEGITICGVPYTALPLATLISVDTDIPMLIRRKETKDYGTKKIVEGSYTQGQSCLIIEVLINQI